MEVKRRLSGSSWLLPHRLWGKDAEDEEPRITSDCVQMDNEQRRVTQHLRLSADVLFALILCPPSCFFVQGCFVVVVVKIESYYVAQAILKLRILLP